VSAPEPPTAAEAPERLRILVTLAYYAPHVSGLTIHARRLAEGLAARGHRVTVLTSRHRPDLPARETLAGVEVVRVTVAWRFGKGAVMPTYLAAALPLLRRADLVAMNLPTVPSESVLLPILARVVLRRPVVATYHCDLQLPEGPFNRLVGSAVRLVTRGAATLAHRLVAYTEDYARASPILRRFPAKLVVIPPPVAMPLPDPAAAAALRRRWAPGGEVLVGCACRLAREKGVDHLLRALPLAERTLGPVRLLFAGETEQVLGEGQYRRFLEPIIAAAGHRWVPLGVLSPQELASFYAACDVTVLPSVNMTESFGLVQVESMLCGTPVVATELPGVRVPVRATGMGVVVPPRDAEALAAAIVRVVQHRSHFVRPRAEVARIFSFADTISRYEALFRELVRTSRPLRQAATRSAGRGTGPYNGGSR